MASNVSERFAKLNREQQRLGALQEFENQNALEQGREARTIEGKDFSNEPNANQYAGAYDHENNPDKLYINNEALDSDYYNEESAKNTIAHEGRHATQHDAVDGKEAICKNGEPTGESVAEHNGYSGEQLEELEDDLEVGNSKAVPGSDEYKNRVSERDARKYAAEKTPVASQSQEDKKFYEQQDESKSFGKTHPEVAGEIAAHEARAEALEKGSPENIREAGAERFDAEQLKIENGYYSQQW